ncbi:MAG TPA: YdeI/OmpD-associated family protein [Spirochaetia bacterium]|nr:YdeI/OmpD-associated family protein [Spirochaetia bacterium]
MDRRPEGANRHAVFHRIQTAKKQETRQKRNRQFVDMPGRHETIYP